MQEVAGVQYGRQVRGLYRFNQEEVSKAAEPQRRERSRGEIIIVKVSRGHGQLNSLSPAKNSNSSTMAGDN